MDGGGSARVSEGLRGKRQICMERCHYVHFLCPLESLLEFKHRITLLSGAILSVQ